MLHASIRENARRARQAGDERTADYWAGREEQFREILQRANRAALENMQAWAGVTRTTPSARILQLAGEHDISPEARAPRRHLP